MKKTIFVFCCLILALSGCEQSISSPNGNTNYIGYTDKDFENLLIGEWTGYEGETKITFKFEETNMVQKTTNDTNSSIYNYNVSGNKLSITVINSGSSMGLYYFYFDGSDILHLRKTTSGQKFTLQRI